MTNELRKEEEKNTATETKELRKEEMKGVKTVRDRLILAP